LILVLVAVPVGVVGLPVSLAAWPVVVGAAVAAVIVSIGFAKGAARRIVAGENRAAAESLEREREAVTRAWAEITDKGRRLDYERQLLRREGAVVAQERRELAEQHKRNERTAGELVGARGHVQRLKRKPKLDPDDGG